MPYFKLESSSCPAQLSPIWQVPRPGIRTLWIEAGHEGALELLKRLPQEGLACVGTRHPHGRSLHLVRSLIESLAATPRIILSGMARGIDEAAHEAALQFGLPTIAVLGCGLGHHYPPGSMGLRGRILDAGGLVISEFEPEEEPRPYRFVQRNRLIAAWSAATCVFEAGHRSGALLTADYALELHRPVFAVPNFPGERGFEGNQRLIDDFSAQPLWAAHSLGSAWLELASVRPGKIFPA